LKKKKVVGIIGSGFSGLSAAAYLAKAGFEVHVFEQNESAGGRARSFSTPDGFSFDMGPSWYWMPDVFENFFADFNSSAANHFELKKLDPSFSVVFNSNEIVDIPSSFEDLCLLFESIEKGAAKQLMRFMSDAEQKYSIAMSKLVHMPGLSVKELLNKEVLSGALKLNLLTNFRSFVNSYFKDERLRKIMEFPILFLGAKPQDTPALYSMMNYAGLKMGTYYPMGGFASVVNAMQQTAESEGATFHFNARVEKIIHQDNSITEIIVNGQRKRIDFVLSAADYTHTETLMDKSCRNYTPNYWSKRTFAPSSLIFYLGIDQTIESLNHHTLFFDESFDQHAVEIYDHPKWPSKPLFYVCCPSKSDPAVAPQGTENLFILIPLASGLKDHKELHKHYFELVVSRFQKIYSIDLSKHLLYSRSYAINDFVQDYNAYGGNAYGLANTLLQTAHFKPSMRNKKLSNLFYSGQLTVPGPGVPPCIVSGKIAAQLINKSFKMNLDEAVV